MKQNKKHWAAGVILFGFVLIGSECMEPKPKPDPRGTAYAPDISCRTCHQAIYDSAVLSAHYMASSSTQPDQFHPISISGQTSFSYENGMKVMVEKRDSGFFQVLYQNGVETLAKRFDISFGSRHAMTWLYWKDSRTYELPLSYYRSANAWGTSPGYTSSQPDFNRLIGKDCFECHSSFIGNLKNTAASGDYFAGEMESEILDPRTLVNGIDCQRCHGPAAQHADFHVANPQIKEAKYITPFKSLNVQQQLDQCAACHSGNDKIKLKSRFQFKPGERLDDYFMIAYAQDSKRKFDVHGNQYNLLNQSKCFLGTKTMTCTTCHNPHNALNENLITYSKQCMTCHPENSDQFCTTKPEPGIQLRDNCIDCHMPYQASNAIQYQLSGSKEVSSYSLRTHKIAVYEMVKATR